MRRFCWFRGLQILSNAAKDSLAQNPIRGQRAIGDLRFDFRFHPGRFRLLDRDRKRRVLDDERIEPFAHVPGNLFRVSASGFPGIEKPSTLPASDIQRGNLARLSPKFFDESNDRESVALHALYLKPGLASARTIPAVPPFTHNPFQAHAACMFEHGFGVPLEMLAIAQSSDIRFGGQLAQQTFAFDQRHAAKVMAVEIKKVENEIDKPVHPVPSQIGIQRFKVWDALLVWDHHLAIEDRCLRGKPGKRLSQGPKTRRPIIASTRVERGGALLEVRLGSVAVILDFMEPIGAVGYPDCQPGQAGFYKAWKWRVSDRGLRLLQGSMYHLGSRNTFIELWLQSLGLVWARPQVQGMKIATFNVNGINGRLPVLLRWLESSKPDVVCLQELKAPQEKFPQAALAKLGYGAIWHGQKSWNGVAILARGVDPVETRRGLPGDADDAHSRYIEATVRGIIVGCLYLPNGNPAPGPKFDYKLRWFERLIVHASELLSLDAPVALIGDYNVMPTDLDVYKPERWVDDALFRPEVRHAFHRLLEQGWTDALRKLHPSERIYTFWDYFRNAWARDAGLRIDHLLLSPILAKRLLAAGVDREVRGWEKASDHAPVWIEVRELGRNDEQAPPRY